MTFGEALRYDRLSYDEEARDAYLEGAATIIANTLGRRRHVLLACAAVATFKIM